MSSLRNCHKRRYMLRHFSCVWLFVTLWTIACQAPLSMGISGQKYWSGLECHALLQGIFPNPGMEPVSLMSSALAGGFFTSSATWEVKGSTALLFSHLLSQEVLCLRCCLFFPSSSDTLPHWLFLCCIFSFSFLLNPFPQLTDVLGPS